MRLSERRSAYCTAMFLQQSRTKEPLRCHPLPLSKCCYVTGWTDWLFTLQTNLEIVLIFRILHIVPVKNDSLRDMQLLVKGYPFSVNQIHKLSGLF